MSNLEHLPLPIQDQGPNPYPSFATLRAHSPIIYNPAEATYVVFRYDDVLQVLRDTETFSSQTIREALAPSMGHQIIIGMDGSEHRRHRALVSSAFSTKAIARWDAELIRPVLHEIIDGFAPRGRADLANEFNFVYPVRVTARLLGLPKEDLVAFQRWSLEILNVAANVEAGMRASKEFSEYLKPIVAARRAQPQDDLISTLVHTIVDGEHLTDEDIDSFVKLLLPAGIETAYRATGNLLFALLSMPEQRKALQDDPGLLPRAVEEALRWESPITMTNRITTREVELCGKVIPKGVKVAVSLGSANHDENRFPNPENFDIRREPKGHLSFGYGPHLCLGIHLARVEIAAAIEILFAKLPKIALDPEVTTSIEGGVFRSPNALRVIF